MLVGSPARDRRLLSSSDKGPADHEYRDQARSPDEQQVLGPEPTRQRGGQESADHGTEDASRAKQREQSLRLAGVHDDPDHPPREESLEHLRNTRREPQDRVDPRGVRYDQCAFSQQYGCDHKGHRHEQELARHAPQEPGHGDRYGEHQPAGQQEHHGQLVNSGSREEQGVDSALTERRAGRWKEHQRDPEPSHPAFTGPNLEHLAEPDHAASRATSV
ncbi:MAG: hypothetical protein ACRDT7_09985 [Microbacterium sp.]